MGSSNETCNTKKEYILLTVTSTFPDHPRRYTTKCILIFRILALGLFICCVRCVDHNNFKNCSRVDFCNTLRERPPQDLYVGDGRTATIVDIGIASFMLHANDGSSDLKVTINSLQDSTFRVKIIEVDSDRYELKDVLNGEPQLAGFDSSSGDDFGMTLTTGVSTAKVTFSPFNIEFTQNDVVMGTLNGNRLILQGSDAGNAFAFGVSFPQAVHTYGLHERADHLALQNTKEAGIDPYRLRNLDAHAFEVGSPMSLYGAVPVLYGHGTKGTAGMFLHNAAQQWIDLSFENGMQAYFMVESATLDVFFFLGPSPVEVVRQYTKLTGTAYVPQLWTLGYHQCRYSYMSQDDVKDVLVHMDQANFAFDSIWLDIDYTNGKRYFTWNPDTYSDPVDMQNTLASTTRKLVTIIDPHIKEEQGYSVYDGALAGDFFVKNADGSVFVGNCWPGSSSWMDFLNPAARDYIASMYSYDNFPSSTSTLAGIWNDMNEPTVFDIEETTLPQDVQHYGGVAHRDIHNIYGFLNTMATNEGLMRRDNGTTRPFILTRSTFAGSQRYTAFWTGDTIPDWKNLAISWPQCLNANLMGLAFCGSDVGGFLGNPSEELLQRWYQASVWIPFFRAHADKGTDRREPYLFSEEVQQVLRDAIQLRYKHLPVWYTLFFEHSRQGDPVIRPLFYHYPHNDNVTTIDNQLLLGRDIMARIVSEPGVKSVQVYFPGTNTEQWISINGDDVHLGTNDFVDIPVTLQSIPVYYRRGSIITRKDSVKRSASEGIGDEYTLYVTLSDDRTAHGTVFLDDFTSFKYRDNNEYAYLTIDASVDDNGQDVINVSKIDDSNSDGFDFNVGQVIYNDVVLQPKNGTPGKYRQIKHERDANGKLLNKIKIDLNAPFTVKLKK